MTGAVFLQHLYASLRSADPLQAIKLALVAEVEAGTERDELRSVLQELRVHLHADQREEAEGLILIAMDLLVGYCRPEERI